MSEWNLKYLPLKSLIRPQRDKVSKNWKSCVGQKPTEGSNPSHCAKIKREFAFFGKFPLDFATFERITVILASQQTAR